MFQRKNRAKELPNDETKEEEDAEITAHKKRYISPEERQQIIDELRLVPKKDAYFLKNYWWNNAGVKKYTYLWEK